MRKSLITVICLIYANISFAQEIRVTQLFGKWRITNYKELEIITPGMEGTKKEETERRKLYLKRGSGVFNIDSNSLSTTNSFLEFDSCKFNLVHKNLATLNIVKNDYSLGYTSSFDLWVERNKVSNDFVTVLDKEYAGKILNVFDTDYRVGYGDETLKICIISIDKIALYRSFDVIILERNKIQKQK